ncbi:hypothetical protein DFR70_11467 [Nocardia tenerifensis]|uniref:Small secreted domain DUF320 n=1 Tax=Nocardia tenerifensis TaxID=228006 RepID=A0A318JTG2_9NOCA|nr:hypothetical protein [Nocardia tenerifensis]PXX58385.1 hypothetical protein DFR70_11467 [Nocardia tenerifensis]
MRLRTAIVLGFAAIMGSSLIAAGSASAVTAVSGPQVPGNVQLDDNGCPIPPRGSDGKPLPPPPGPDGRPLPPPTDANGNPCPAPDRS